MDVIGDVIMDVILKICKNLNIKNNLIKSLCIFILSIVFIAVLFGIGYMMSK